MKSIFEYYKTIDSVEYSSPSWNRSSNWMEIDKPDCESSDVLDSEKEDDIEKRIKTKYKLLWQELLAAGGKMELDSYLEVMLLRMWRNLIFWHGGKLIHPNIE